jgi:hypothetical protein
MDGTSPLMRLPGEGEMLMVSLEGNIEKCFIRFHNTVQADIPCHFMERIKDLVPPGKGCRNGNIAFFGSFLQCLFVQQAVQISGPDRKPFSGPGCDGL